MSKVDNLINYTTFDALSRLVVACMAEDGKPKTPSKQELLAARSMLPPRCPGTLVKSKE